MQNSLARSSVDVGSVIADTYTIEALIGRGGMGAVFLASHKRLPGKKVAIKVLHAELGGDEIHKRFKREAHIASMLSHPNIVHIEDYNVTAEGMPYLVLEYLQGESLAQRLKRGPLPLEQVISILRQIGSALATAHAKGIVHRDLKPQNIFLVPSEHDGRSIEIAKVLDFGISKIRDSTTMQTQDSALLGTPQYMAPEQAKGEHDRVDQRSDIFALGAIVYEMLSGHAAFSGQTIPEVVFKVVYEQPVELGTRVPAISDSVKAAVQRAMAKDADERFASVSGFLEALTGAPVSLIRNPPKPVSTVDVSAPTMGSGDHTAPPVSVDAATIISQGPEPAKPELGLANTVSSGDHGAALAAPAQSSKRGVFVVVGVLAAAGAAAGIMYAVMREPPAPPQQVAKIETRAAPPQQVEPPRVVEAAAPPAPAAIDAGVSSPPPPPVEQLEQEKPAKKTDKRTGAGKAAPIGYAVVPPEPDATNDDDTNAGTKLREAIAALVDRQWKVAGQAATLVITSQDAKPKQRAQATMVLGVVACNTNDDEGARKSVRALESYLAMQQRVIVACHANGLLQGIPASPRRRGE